MTTFNFHIPQEEQWADQVFAGDVKEVNDFLVKCACNQDVRSVSILGIMGDKIVVKYSQRIMIQGA